jgi:methylphosphotriester-DNA--protein-cysteine methyltransferase
VVHDSQEWLALSQGYRVAVFCHELGISDAYLRQFFMRDMLLTPEVRMRRERMVVARRMLGWGMDSMKVGYFLFFRDLRVSRESFRVCMAFHSGNFWMVRRPNPSEGGFF